MCKIMDEMKRDAVQERNYEFAEKLLNKKIVSKEEIAELADITIEEVEELAKELQIK